MKKLTLLIVAVGIGILAAKAQSLNAATYVEQTHISAKVGTAFGYTFSSNIELGGFYQQAAQPVQREYGRPLMEEEEFYGVFFAYPIIGSDKANLKMNVRTGVSNGENFVITPGVVANYSPFKKITLSSGVGTRAFRPTLMASLKVNL